MVKTKADLLGKPLTGWRLQFYTVIFEADTRAGRRFDQALIGIILASVAVVVADSVQGITLRFHREFTWVKWLFTLVFTLEYLVRLPSNLAPACPTKRWTRPKPDSVTPRC